MKKQITTAPGATQAAPSPFMCQWALERLQDELDALYALASAALTDLEPKEGQTTQDIEHFMAFKMVQMMHERLESANLMDSMRYVLIEEPRKIHGTSQPTAGEPLPTATH